MFELLFHVGDNRERNTTIPRASIKPLSEDLTRLQVPSEVPRRPRAVDYKNYKASEWRNLTLYYFPLVVHHLPRGLHQQMWLEFAFICRAYSIEDSQYQALNKKELKNLALKWYRNYHNLFGSNNMRYVIHIMAHLEKIREHGPFSEISAFPFEGSFAASARVQKPGTTSFGLQGIRHSFIRPREGHKCEKTIVLTSAERNTPRTDNSLVYTEAGMYQIVEEVLPEVTEVTVKKLETGTYYPPIRSNLDFGSVGVQKYLFSTDISESVKKTDIRGKVIALPVEGEVLLVKISLAELREAD